MAIVVLCILFLLVAGVGVVVGIRGKAKQARGKGDGAWRTIGFSVAAVAVLLSVTIYVGGSYNRVPARNLGIVSSQGKVQKEILHPGAHWLDPWESVENLDTTNQPLKMIGQHGSSCDDSGASCKDPNWIPWVEVRVGNQTIAHVDVTVLWHINDDEASVIALYNANKNTTEGVFERVRDNVVETQVKHAVGVVFGHYNPLANVTDATSDGPTSTDVLETQVLDYLSKQSSLKGITLVSLIINNIHVDQTTQDQLNKYAQVLAAQRIAEQQAKVNAAIVAANQILAADTSTNNPGVRYQNCLQLIRDLAASGALEKLPPGTLSCDPNSGLIVSAK